MQRDYLISVILIVLISIERTFQDVDDVIRKRNNHKALDHNESIKKHLANLEDSQRFNEIIDNILIERVVGTEGHEKVRNYIVDQMNGLGWDVKLDEFEDKTPFGNKNFKNIITSLNPNAERYLLMACHYDSKFFKDKKFLGATDSAVPCAMLIDIAHALKKHLTKAKDKTDLSIMFVFFDGEEAFVDWTATDSIYGARHLAKKWEEEKFLHKIDVFMLLDLLGAPDPLFYSLYDETHKWYTRLSGTEDYLSESDLMQRYTTSGVSMRSPNKFFNEYSIKAGIEDDHVPFLRRNVPILHLIPVPFPTVWHKLDDDRSAFDVVTCENLMKVFRIFIAEYLNLAIDTKV